MLGNAYNKLNEMAKEYDAKRKRELSELSTIGLERMYRRTATSHNDQVLIMDVLHERYSSLSDYQLDHKLTDCENHPFSECPPKGLIMDIIVERHLMGKYKGIYRERVEQWEYNYGKNRPDLFNKYTGRG